MSVVINNTDITKCVQESTYKCDSYPVYTEWTDASGNVHRNFTRNRIKGSFELVFVAGYTIAASAFITLINSATTNHVMSIKVSVNNTAETKTINCYYSFTCDPPRKINGSLTFNKAKFEFEEV